MTSARSSVVSNYSVLLSAPAHNATSVLAQKLRSVGIDLDVRTDPRAALEAAGQSGAVALVLDTDQPGLEVAGFLRDVHRAAPALPVIALTAREHRRYTAACLRGYRDDYLVTPFPVDELLTRLELRVRSGERPGHALLRQGGIVLDPARQRVSVDARDVQLSPTEFALLEALMCRPGRAVSRQLLTALVWGNRPESNVVEVYVGYLRRKLGPDRIRTLRGTGYVLDG